MSAIMKQQTNVQGWRGAGRRGALNAPECAPAHQVLAHQLMVSACLSDHGYSRNGYVTRSSRSSRSCFAPLLEFLHERCKGVAYPFTQRSVFSALTTVIPQKCGIHAITGTAGGGVCFGAVTAGLARFLVLWAAKVHGMDPAWGCGMTVRGVV